MATSDREQRPSVTPKQLALEREIDDKFIVMHRAKRHRSTSIENELYAIRRFRDYVGAPPWYWTVPKMTEYAAELNDGFAAGTVLHLEGAVRRYCAFARDPGYDWDERAYALTGHHIPQVCTPENTLHHGEVLTSPIPRALTHQELHRLFRLIRREIDHLWTLGARAALPACMHFAALCLCLAYGARESEAVMIEEPDITTPSDRRRRRLLPIDEVHIRYGKAHNGGPPKPRTVASFYLFRAYIAAVVWYMREIRPQLVRPGSPSTLLLGQRGESLRGDSLSAIFRSYRDRAELSPDLTLHCLRHTFGTLMYASGLDLPTLAVLMGHKHESTTAIYARLLPSVVRERSREHNRRLMAECDRRCARRA